MKMTAIWNKRLVVTDVSEVLTASTIWAMSIIIVIVIIIIIWMIKWRRMSCARHNCG
jgi:hypothetical protein